MIGGVWVPAQGIVVTFHDSPRQLKLVRRMGPLPGVKAVEIIPPGVMMVWYVWGDDGMVCGVMMVWCVGWCDGVG